jgi:hypothetical protein
MTAVRMEIARSRRDGAASSPCAAHSIGRLQRAMARDLAIQLRRPVAPMLDVGSSPEPRRHGTQRWRITAVARSYRSARDRS